MARVAVVALALVLVAIVVPLSAIQSAPEQVPSAGYAPAPTEEATPLRYGIHGKLTVHPGQRDKMVAILLRDVEALKAVGCDLYMVSVSDKHPDDVFVTEVWTSPEAHRGSLALPSVKAAIAEARPLMTGAFEQAEFQVVGGLGVPERAGT